MLQLIGIDEKTTAAAVLFCRCYVPWMYPNFPLLRDVFQLRNALVPYLYSAAFESSRTAVLPVHALYLDWPEEVSR